MKPTNTVAKLFSSVSTLAVVAGAMAFNGVAWGEGAVLAWGLNDSGQCTVPVEANNGVSAIAGGYHHTVALKGGAVLAWGNNYHHQCEIPDAAKSGVSAIAGAYDHVIALKDGAVLSWSNNYQGQNVIPIAAQSGVSAIAAGSWHNIALKDGVVLAWGAGLTTEGDWWNFGQSIVPDVAKSGVTAIAGGGFHTIALKDGKVLAWGSNSKGQCTIPVYAQSEVTAIAGGFWHTIALKNGEVLAWGAGSTNTGDPDFGQSIVPDVAKSGVTAIAGGAFHTIALKNGAVLAWGNNGNSQCTIPDLAKSGVTAITGGGLFTVALKDPNDIDGDGIPNATDNCPSVNNPTQADCDGNGVGDACETFTDCNANGVADICEILSGAVTDQNLNGIPDTCEVSSVSRVLPISGPSTGGTAVRIIGTNFFSALPVSVTFGGAPATDVVVVSLTEITAVTPSGSPGDTVVTVNGASAEAFYYRPSCDGDLDNNGTIDSSDLGLLLINMGDCSSSLTTQQPQEPMIFPMPEAAKPVAVKK